MLDHAVVTKWVVDLAVLQTTNTESEQFFEAAQAAWPRVLACTRRAASNRQITPAEVTSLALEIWEVTLRSIWKTLQQIPDGEAKIGNLSNYLIGAFHHRLNQHLKKDRHRNAVLDFVPAEELSELEDPGMADDDCEDRMHRKIQLMEVYTAMDEHVRRALIARTHGFSWREIAGEMGIAEQNLIMRVQYAIRKMRTKFAGLPGGAKTNLKSLAS